MGGGLLAEVQEQPVPALLAGDVDVGQHVAGLRQVTRQIAERERVAIGLLPAEHQLARVRDQVTLRVRAAEPERVAADVAGLLHLLLAVVHAGGRVAVVLAHAQVGQSIREAVVDGQVQRQGVARLDEVHE